jgi:hypothetical protein
MAILNKILNVQGEDDFKEIAHVLINEDGMKMPIFRNDNTSSAIGFKFIINPTAIDNLDDLFDAFEANKDTNVKYVVMYNNKEWNSPKKMTL